VRDEDVYVLDEPTHGLDPVWTQRFRAIVTELRRPERVILVASHNLDELERIADRVAILDRGRVQRVVATAPRRAAAATVFRLAVASGADDVRVAFPEARPLGAGEFEVQVADLAALNRGLGTLLARGVLLAAVAPAHSALEQQFREAVERDGAS
jgi:ABC-type multidrug transport system ATPase subunit